MYVGVDVGGTYTDAVLVENGRVRATAKVPTGKDLLEPILKAMDIILKDVDKKILRELSSAPR